MKSMTLLPRLVVGQRFFSAKIGMPEESQKKITTTDLKRKKYVLIPLILSNAIPFVKSQDVKPLPNQKNLRVSSAAIKSSMKAQENTLLVKRRIGLDGNFISGETVSKQMLGKCYNALTDDFSSAQFILQKKNKIIITSPDLYSSYAGDFMSTQAYVDELLKIEGRINIQYNKIEIEGEAVFENTYKDEKSSISLFQIGYDQYEAVEFNQNILQAKWAYKSSKFLHAAAGTTKERLDNFISTHGNYYVNKVTTGVFAVRQVKFDFGSEENKLDIEASVSGKIDLKALSIEFSAAVTKADEETRKALTISVKQGTIGGDPTELQVNFKESFDKIESVLLDSWNNFFRKSSANKTKYASALSAELVLISGAVHPSYSRSQDDSARLHRKYKEARERINNLQSHKLRIDMALKRTKFMIEGLGTGAAGSIRELLYPLKSMGDDFKTYHLTKALNKFEDYLSRGENYILETPVPNEKLSCVVDVNNPDENCVVDVNNPDKNWLKAVNLTLDFGTMEEIFTLLEGAGRIQGQIGTYTNVLIDGPVAWGAPAGVPNELLFYYETDTLKHMTIQEKNSKWVFKYKGEHWNLFTGMPKKGSLPIPRNSEEIRFDDLPKWFTEEKYLMSKKYENSTFTRSYKGFFRNNKFFDEGVLTNEGFLGNNIFHSCDVKWSRDYHLHIAKAFILKDDVIYTGEVKYSKETMTFTMHGDGEINYTKENNSTVLSVKGTWHEDKYIVDSEKKFEDLKLYHNYLYEDASRVKRAYPSSQPTGIPSIQPTVLPSTQPTFKPSITPSTQLSPTPSTAPTITTQPTVERTPAPTPSTTHAPTTRIPIFVSDYFFSGSKQIEKSLEGQPDAFVINPPTDYSLRFTIEPKGKIPAKSSIIHFTKGGNTGEYGQVVPGIFFLPDTTTLHIRVNFSVHSVYHIPPYELEVDKKYYIEVHVYGTRSSFYVNGVHVSQVTIGTRPQLNQVNVYIGDPWYPAANALISDISFTKAVKAKYYIPTFVSHYFYSGSQQIEKSVHNQPDAVVINPPIDYSLRFTIVLKDIMGGNIVHFTTGGVGGQTGVGGEYGKRVPMINVCGGTGRMRIYYMGDDTSHYVPYTLELNTKHSIEVHIYGTKSTVFLNGVRIHQLTIDRPRTQLDRVNVYIGDPWYPAANAIISDISFTEAREYKI